MGSLRAVPRLSRSIIYYLCQGDRKRKFLTQHWSATHSIHPEKGFHVSIGQQCAASIVQWGVLVSILVSDAQHPLLQRPPVLTISQRGWLAKPAHVGTTI